MNAVVRLEHDDRAPRRRHDVARGSGEDGENVAAMALHGNLQLELDECRRAQRVRLQVLRDDGILKSARWMHVWKDRSRAFHATGDDLRFSAGKRSLSDQVVNHGV